MTGPYNAIRLINAFNGIRRIVPISNTVSGNKPDRKPTHFVPYATAQLSVKMRPKLMWLALACVLAVKYVDAAGCQKQSNKDIHGGQAIRDVSGRRESDCCQLCRETSGCKAYAWNSYQGGTCWLKSASGPIVDAAGTSIGILDGSGGNPGGSGVGQLGICYSPFHHPNYGSAATIRSVLTEDIKKIKSLGFNSIRTYYAEYFGQSIADILNEQGGVTAALGIYMYPDHADWIDAQINTAAAAAKRYPGLIKAIYVGNENIPPVGGFSVDSLIGYINKMKQKLSQQGVSVPVGTVQRYTEWVSGREDVKRLVNACDVIGANLYPFFNAGTNPADPVPVFDSQLQSVKNKFPGKRIEITETGWPSGGSTCNGSSQPRSVDQIRSYFQKMRDWSRSHSEKVYYFQDFNKVTNPGNDCENYFGIMDAYGNKKFDI
ncbi:uncharacterized protein LOC129602033 [Paramacrobiotus metropolitanus]|uniref:uncharacterized protein LOC129602033 n=1 Tax=Paramacrobiotus metropolitanus TaxID=2943436 RepID=UPI002446529A|nr:uncharacterized protein LOC129602033 [Paramacrobiotus metropolitanus]